MNIEVQHYDLLTYLNAVDSLESIPIGARLCLRMGSDLPMLQFMLAYDVYIPGWTSTAMICGQVPSMGDSADPPIQGTVMLTDFLALVAKAGAALSIHDFMSLGVEDGQTGLFVGEDRVDFTPLEIAWPEEDRCPTELSKIHMSHGPSNAISWVIPVKDTGELTVHATTNIPNNVGQYMALRRKIGGPLPAGLEDTIAAANAVVSEDASAPTLPDVPPIQAIADDINKKEEEEIMATLTPIEAPVSVPEGSSAPCTSGAPELAQEPPVAQKPVNTDSVPPAKPKDKRTRRSSEEIKQEKIEAYIEFLEKEGYSVDVHEVTAESMDTRSPDVKLMACVSDIHGLLGQIGVYTGDLVDMRKAPDLADELKELLAKHGA